MVYVNSDPATHVEVYVPEERDVVFVEQITYSQGLRVVTERIFPLSADGRWYDCSEEL